MGPRKVMASGGLVSDEIVIGVEPEQLVSGGSHWCGKSQEAQVILNQASWRSIYTSMNLSDVYFFFS